MKKICVVVILLTSLCWAKKKIDPATYKMDAVVMAYESSTEYKQVPTHDAKATAANGYGTKVTGYGTVADENTRVEIRIDQTTYIGSCYCSLQVGDHYKARWGGNALDDIVLLGTNRKGKPDTVTIWVTGKRMN